jgi:hypothetical protein
MQREFSRCTDIFFTEKDESDFSFLLRSQYPKVTFIDNCIWPSAEPPLRQSISDCQSPFAFVWNRAIVPSVVFASSPHFKRSDGTYTGPASGVVIQIVRCDIEDSTLLRSGRMAASADDRPMIEFIKGTWQLLSAFARARPFCVNPFTREVLNLHVSGVLIGPDAADWCVRGPNRFLKDRSTPNYFLPKAGRKRRT